MFRPSICLFLCLIVNVSCKDTGPSSFNKAGQSDKDEWQTLFNGEDLEGWTPKIGGYEYGVNGLNTFRVTDGVLEINYDEYDTFTTQYGHLFYERPFSSYHMMVEYRFKGDQTPGGQGWAYRNSGIMFHSQDPKTMTIDQFFPICVEYQFLGGNGEDQRSTGNLCTPNSHVTIDDELVTTHCISSTSDTYHGDQWVTAELLVYGDSIIHHIIEGDTVMTYTHPIFDAKDAPDGGVNYVDGQPLTQGYIALQAESHPMEYKTVKIRDLSISK
ncbi:3-keto-disaccharide hydrolase [Portibacter marinus]|uniref:3-keto-disaccharide hydrolase n=1 Tax=Portibacter marinus TaxID=2898660 RepID=UPI001F411941|nr:DUF1080 domain-containing protein [Portibacter marinus]